MINNFDRDAYQLTTDEYVRWRAAGIGGSAAPVIMRAAWWETPLENYLRRQKLIPPQEVTYRMRRGLRLEPEARQEYEKLVGFPAPARCLASDRWPVARASFDGLNEAERRVVEIKCPCFADHALALKEQIPDPYVWQCVHILFVLGYKSVDYFSYNPDFKGPKTALVRLKWSNFLERRLLAKEREFWNFVVSQTPPPPGPKELAWPWPKYVSQTQRREP